MSEAAFPFTCDVVIGRDGEIGLIDERLRRAEPGVLLISGDPGIGKSRLVEEALARAAALGYPLARGHCLENEASSPYAAVADLLQAIRRATGEAPFAELAPAHRAALARAAPALRFDAPAGSAADAVQEKHALADALASLVRALPASAERPLPTVAIEDLHWADGVTLELLLALARRAGAVPLLLVLTYRDDEVGPELAHLLAELDRGRLAHELAVRPLDTAGTEAMIRAILRIERAVPADLLHIIATLTEGNPFFIEEVLTSLSAGGQLTREAGSWRLVRSEEPRIPRSVQDAVRRRTGRVSARAKRVLQIAAVAGHRFDFDLLTVVSGLAEAELIAAVRELIAARLVVETGADRFAFRHALTRQAVSAELLTRERALLHREIADALAVVPDAAPADLAEHAFQAGLWPEAQAAARQAGERALAMHAPRAAAEHFSRALIATEKLGRAPDPRLLRSRGAAYETLGEFERALADFAAAHRAARSAGNAVEEVEALLALGLLWSGRDYEAAGDCLAEALAVARTAGDDALLARALNRMGNWLLNRERQAEGIAHHEEALAIFERAGDEREVAATLDLIGMASFLGGDVVRGAASLERAVRLWRALDDRRGLAGSLALLSASGPNFHSTTVPSVRRASEGLAAGDEAIRIAREIGWRAGESWALWATGGLCAGSHGRYGRALADVTEGLAVAEAIDHIQWQAGALCMLGNIRRDLLDVAGARAALRRAVELAERARSPYWELSALAWLAETEVEAGELDAAAAALARTRAHAPSMATIAGRLVWLATAELELARGDAPAALAITDRLLDGMPNRESHGPVPTLCLLRGRSFLALDRLDEAGEELRGGLAITRDREAWPLAWRLELELARCLRRQGRDAAAAAAWEGAWAVVDDLAATIPDEETRERFLTAAAARFPRRQPARRARGAGQDELTEREREVAALLTRGLSNREIAAELFISDWTVATHVRNILAKLGFSSRAQIAAWAVEQGLAPAPPPPNT